MSKTLEQRLTEILNGGSRAERLIATHMLADISSLPFQTPASIAQQVGVSKPTVGRFCRTLGYQSFKAMKSDLEHDISGASWLLGDRLNDFYTRSKNGEDLLGHCLELEIASLVRIYEMSRTEQWERAVSRLANSLEVYIVGFQTERGLAQYFANQLQYLRPNVHLVDVAGGNFSDILMQDGKSATLVMFEARRYSRLSKQLAKEARSRSIPVTLITDAYCDWAHDVADEVFPVPTDFGMFWESSAQMASLSNLLMNSIFKELGPKVEERMNAVTRLHSDFTGYVNKVAPFESK